MAIEIPQLQNILKVYNRQLRVMRFNEAKGKSSAPQGQRDSVSISAEGKRLQQTVNTPPGPPTGTDEKKNLV
ncbi:MAG: hypothetical protein HQK60_13870 [Deltaproteobacteria bacterium]|nr:hypothetical protein [Deltaproteobacteria bacterium]